MAFYLVLVRRIFGNFLPICLARPFVVQKTTKTGTFQPMQDIAGDKDISPEVIRGNGFLDVIIHLRGIVEISDIKTKLDNLTNVLSIKIPKFDKTYSVSLPNSDNFVLDILSISVINGIIKIRIKRVS